MLSAGVGWANGFNTSSTFESTKLHKNPAIQSQAVAAVVTMDMGTCYYGYGHGYVIERPISAISAH